MHTGTSVAARETSGTSDGQGPRGGAGTTVGESSARYVAERADALRVVARLRGVLGAMAVTSSVTLHGPGDGAPVFTIAVGRLNMSAADRIAKALTDTSRGVGPQSRHRGGATTPPQ